MSTIEIIILCIAICAMVALFAFAIGYAHGYMKCSEEYRREREDARRKACEPYRLDKMALGQIMAMTKKGGVH